MAKKGQKLKFRDEKIIYQIVMEKNKGKTYSYLEKKYGITRGSMMTWVKRYKDKGYISRDRRGIKKNLANMTIDELRIEVDILKKFQAFLKRQHELK